MLSGDICRHPTYYLIFHVLNRNAVLGLLPVSTMTRIKGSRNGILSSPVHLIISSHLFQIPLGPLVPDSHKSPCLWYPLVPCPKFPKDSWQ